MAFAAFGPGILIITRTDTVTPLAINVGYVQELTLDVAGTTKRLYGQNQYPLVAARATIQATAKFKAAEISGIAWNAFFYGQTFVDGRQAWTIDSTFLISTSSATVAVGSSLTFGTDLGVWYSTVGLPMQRVAPASEVAGKYSLSGNVYTFAAADQGKGIKVTYTAASTSGQTLAITNQAIGSTPTFQADYYTNLNQPGSTPFAVRLYQCIAGKQSMPFKLEDFMIPEFDLDYFADATGRVFDLYFPQVS